MEDLTPQELEELRQQMHVAEDMKKMLVTPAWEAAKHYINTIIQESYSNLCYAQQHRMNVASHRTQQTDMIGVVEFETDDILKGKIKALVGLSDYINAVVNQGTSAAETLHEYQKSV